MDLLFLSTFGKAFVPKGLRKNIRHFFEKTGREEVPYEAFGALFWTGTLISYIIYITQIYPAIQGKGAFAFILITLVAWTGLMLSIIFAIGGVGYFWLTMVIYKRTREMEEKLPDYLTLVSTSLKGGYSFEKALWGAIKPEFGILANEISLVSKRVMTGNDVTDALEEFSNKFESPILRRAMDLINGELEAGGKVADVIDRVIMDLKKTRMLKEEMAASTLTYMIFIAALVMFVMPLLFALSFVLFNVITGFIGNIAANTASSPIAMLKLSSSGVSAEDYKIFTVLAITIISCASAFIVSIIEKGDIISGLKYVPMFWLTSLFMYFLFLSSIGGLFGSVVKFGG